MDSDPFVVYFLLALLESYLWEVGLILVGAAVFLVILKKMM